MARKKHAEEHVNLERWLVSYADFITLLFATFVVLYALSQLDLAKFKDLKISLAKAFSASPTILDGDPGVLDKSSNSTLDTGGEADSQNIIPPMLDQPYAKQEESDFQGALDSLNKNSKENGLSKSKNVQTEVSERGLVIKLLGNVAFESSTATIKKESYKTLDEIGNLIKTKFPNHLIRVEGHTDSLAIKSSVYPSNWELSSARAAAIVRYMISKFNVPEDRFSALGYSDSRPVASNILEEGRKLNRRVEIVILRNNLIKTESVSDKFKIDLKKEIEKFKNIEKSKKGDTSPEASDAVKNLLKSGESDKNLIIFDNAKDKYKQDAARILKELKEKEQQDQEAAKIRKQEFFKSVRGEFGNKK